MAAVEHHFQESDIHPIDMVETLAEQCAWDFDRVGEDQIAVAVEGAWRTYSLSLMWSSRSGLLLRAWTQGYFTSRPSRANAG